MIVQNMKSGLTVGFAEEFYTLWHVEAPDEHGNQRANYIKKISKDINKTKELYPDAHYTDLRGESWQINSLPKIDLPDDVFHFGRYYSKKFNEVNDLDYLKWYYRTVPNDILKNIIVSHGQIFYEGLFFDNENDLNEFKIEQEVENRLESDKAVKVDVEFSSNLRFERDTELGTLCSVAVNILGCDRHYAMFPYGQRLYFTDMNFDIVKRSYGGYVYCTPEGWRTMKRKRYTVEYHKNRFLKILNPIK